MLRNKKWPFCVAMKDMGYAKHAFKCIAAVEYAAIL
jgi:hypothetical protein